MPRFTDYTVTFWARKDIIAARQLMYFWRKKIKAGDESDITLMKYWAKQAFVSWQLEHRAPSQAVRPPRQPRVRQPYVRKTRRERPHPALRRDAPKKPHVKKVVIDDWMPSEMRWD